MTGKVTLALIRVEARRVYGSAVTELIEREPGSAFPAELVVCLGAYQIITYAHKSKMAARRFALETLRALLSKGGDNG